MKSYKLVNSREVQEKAFRLGYEWASGSRKVTLLDKPFLFLDGKHITYGNEVKFYVNHENQEITQADFLALPEPVKVGDWVKFDSNGRVVVFKVAVLNNENEAFWLDSSMDDRYFNLNYCTKLTDEQIEVLEL